MDMGIYIAVVVGVIAGASGRLLPGRERAGVWLTVAVGVAAALLGTLVAAVVGVDRTGGIDWIEMALQIAFAFGAATVARRLLLRRVRTP